MNKIVLHPVNHAETEPPDDIEDVVQKHEPDLIALELPPELGQRLPDDPPSLTGINMETLREFRRHEGVYGLLFTLFLDMRGSRWWHRELLPETDPALRIASDHGIPIGFFDPPYYKYMNDTGRSHMKDIYNVIRIIISKIRSHTNSNNSIGDLVEEDLIDFCKVAIMAGRKYYKHRSKRRTIASLLLAEEMAKEEKREEWMARSLYRYSQDYGTVVALCGAGHTPMLSEMLEEANTQIDETLTNSVLLPKKVEI